MPKLLPVLLAGVVFTGLSVAANSAENDDTIRIFMRAKLDHSQKILEGLTTEDFATIARHGQELALLSQAANWRVLQTEDYLHHSVDFRRAANALKEAAQDKNLEAATLAYMAMTMSCVNCHKYVRGVRTADNVNPHGEGEFPKTVNDGQIRDTVVTIKAKNVDVRGTR